MAREFLGNGWAFPLQITPQGQIAESCDQQGIEESIYIILSTSKGERIMRPDFGCGIHDFTFGALNSATIVLVEQSIREALTIWEPRIEVESVEVSSQFLHLGQLTITVSYKIRRTNNRYNYVYPFYLTEAQK